MTSWNGNQISIDGWQAAGAHAPATVETARLPPQITSFVGRQAELAEVVDLVRTSRLVTVVGAAGLGKTRLAVELARRHARTAGTEAWFVSRAALSDGALVPQEVAVRLGVSEEPGEPLLQTLATRICARPGLLILDN